jgi:hypothetical protein
MRKAFSFQPLQLSRHRKPVALMVKTGERVFRQGVGLQEHPMSKPNKRVALSLITALTALSICGGAYAQSAPAPAPEGTVLPPTIDSNEDGKADAWDRDGNGTPDAWDVNGDGKPDKFDDDGDGKPDAKPKTR